MIPARYEWNMKALSLIMELSELYDIQLTVYIPPLRKDVEIPYDLHEYLAFKQEVLALAEAHKVSFADLDSIVPGELWGFKASTNSKDEPEIDYMHFQGKGHELLANSLQHLLIDTQ